MLEITYTRDDNPSPQDIIETARGLLAGLAFMLAAHSADGMEPDEITLASDICHACAGALEFLQGSGGTD